MNIKKHTYTILVLAMILMIAPHTYAAPPTQDTSTPITADNVGQVVELQQLANRYDIDAPAPFMDTSALATNLGILLYDEDDQIFGTVQNTSIFPSGNVAWSPNKDFVARRVDFGTMGVFEYPSLNPIISVTNERGEDGFVTFSPDSQQLLTSGNFYDHTLKLWDIETGTLLHTLVGHHSYVVRSTFLNNGQHILSVAYDGTLNLWDTETGELISTTESEPQTADVAISPDDSIAYVGARYGIITAINLDNFTILWQQNIEGSDIKSLAVSPDGSEVLVGASAGQLQRRDAMSGELISLVAVLGDSVADVAYSPDGGTLYAFQSGFSHVKPKLYAFDQSGENIIADFTLNTSAILSLLPFNAQAPSFFHEQDGYLAEFDSRSGETIRTFENVPLPVGATAHPLNDNHVLLATTQLSESKSLIRQFSVVDLDSGEVLHEIIAPTTEIEPPISPDAEILFSISPDKEHLTVAAWDGRVHTWNLATGEQLPVITNESLDEAIGILTVRDVAWSPDSSQLLILYQNRVAHIYDTESGTPLQTYAELDRDIKNVQWWADNQQIAIAYQAEKLRVLNLETGESLLEIEITDYVQQVAFAHHHNLLAFATNKGDINFVDLESREIVHTLSGHTSSIWEIEWSNDDSQIRSIGSDGTQRIWGIPAASN